MARTHWFLCLVACLVALLSPTSAVEINEIFTVQGTAANGGCDNRMATLKDWRQECEVSIKKALEAIGRYAETKGQAGEQGDQGALSSRALMIQDAMTTWFSVKLRSKGDAAAVKQVKQEIQWVHDFFTRKTLADGTSEYPRSHHWLHCDSTFLDSRNPGDGAQAFDGTDIKDDNGNPVAISAIPGYLKRLREGNAWWGGNHATPRGYYFSDEGGLYCSGTGLGLTAGIQPLKRGADGKAEVDLEIQSVILCPSSFDTSPRPNSYREASNLLQAGTNLAEAVPKSATLLHEVFHALRGGYFLAGKVEQVDLGQCISFNAQKKRTNPENYVFFFAHMTHLFGVADGSQPWSIPNNWDFEIQGPDRIFGAKQPST
ncbi:unnamed protein product [Clonostachys solani]|uniref:Lysine-specific metallo-endopeptidase domain-containing protein n=1 Tax=Clonostachys solani TaxID=160281 RepID=A0A9N9ZJX0_9HYPO|nr:unnamed protein product [Clonostachys solani]